MTPRITSQASPGDDPRAHHRDLDMALRFWLGDPEQPDPEVSAWLAADPDRRAYCLRLQDELQRGGWADFSEQETNQFADRIMGATGIADSAQPIVTPSASRDRTSVAGAQRSSRMRSIAGIASLAAVAGLIFGLVTWQSDSAATPDRVVTTVPGQRLTIALDDGIKATLAPATTLRVTSHGVTVHGEAHFHVAHVSHRPFTVQTDNAVVRVLGTAFSVRRYDGEHESRIVVTEGKVVLTAGASHARAHESVVLTAGMFGRVNDSVIQSAAQVPVHNYIGWDDGRLVFKRVPLTEVAAELSRAYGTRVSVRDTTLGKQPMTLDAVVDTQPLTQVLEFISRVTGAHYKRVDSTFVLVPGRVAGNDSQKQSLPQPERSYGTYGK